MDFRGVVNKRKKTVVVLWAIVFLALVPVLLNYTQYIGYSITPGSISSSESARAQRILSTVSSSNSTLVVVFQPTSNESREQIMNETLTFQEALAQSHVPYLSASTSAFSDYKEFLKQVITTKLVSGVKNTYDNFSLLGLKVYDFPSTFLSNWNRFGSTQESIQQAAAASSYNGSKYESLFLQDLNDTFQNLPIDSPATVRVQNATGSSAIPIFFNSSPFLIFPVVDTIGYNVTNYQSNMLLPVSKYLSGYSKLPISSELVESILVAGNNASEYHFEKYGISDAPSFITQRYVSSDNSTYLINVNFNISENFRASNNFYPAQNDTAMIQSLAIKYLGDSALVTGQGAVASDTNKVSQSSGYVFGLIFVFLALAVGIIFVSFLPSLLVLLVVSLATGLGYVSIYITGLILGSVDYVVTYSLTAVVLGVSTDYFIFILWRYRDELREGKAKEVAILNASRRAGRAVLVSGITVASSLGVVSFVSGLESWGPVLCITILVTMILEVSLVPAMIGWIGPRIFSKRSMRIRPDLNSEIGHKAGRISERSSFLYSAIKFSTRHSLIVLVVILMLAIPSIYLWFALPTTYNINTGLPQGTSSVAALDSIDQKFGANMIYPTFVVVNLTHADTTASNKLTPTGILAMEADAVFLENQSGVRDVEGPTIFGSTMGPSIADSQFIFNNGSNAYFLVFTEYDPYSSNAINLVNHLRDNSAFIIGGLTSSIIDLQKYYTTAFQQLEILILLVIAIILALSFRSLTFPFVSLSGVFISITWSTTILYFLVGFFLKEDLVFLIPIILYVILMSLGNDYAVFIFSRIREEQEKKQAFRESLMGAMSSSGAVVTALGLILAVSLGSLALVPFGLLEQIGIAFVVSLLVDTFVIRMLYFPSLLCVLNRKKIPE